MNELLAFLADPLYIAVMASLVVVLVVVLCVQRALRRRMSKAPSQYSNVPTSHVRRLRNGQ